MGGRGGCLVQANTTDMPFAMTSQPFLQKDRIGVEYLTTHTQFLLQVNGDELVSTASARGLSTICPVPLASVFVTMSRRQTSLRVSPRFFSFLFLEFGTYVLVKKLSSHQTRPGNQPHQPYGHGRGLG